MSTNQRGLVIFIVFVAAATFFCYLLPFVIMPGAGVAMALPVIQVPGEVWIYDWPSPDFEFTNTLAGTLLADFVVLVIVAVAWRKSKGWTKEVPGRFQSMVELLAGFFYGLVKQMAGESKRTRTALFPLVASIFLFLVIANWLELVPGVDSVGILHCAGKYGTTTAYPRASTALDGVYQLENTQTMYAGFTADYEDYKACEKVLHPHEEEGDHSEVAAEGDHSEEVAVFDEPVLHYTVEEGDTLESVAAQFAEYGVTAASISDLNDGIVALEPGEEIVVAELVGTDAIVPDNNLFVVTPFFRAAATDLNLTLGLALVSFFAIQYFGIAEQGLNYFQKFVNLHALGNISKKPMGAIDFAVGLFEIISELSKVISLAFRLFGNIFAGQLLLFIMAFLIATMLPVIFYGLEFIVGFIQALVFAVLTLVFSAQAMAGHHGDDHEHEGH